MRIITFLVWVCIILIVIGNIAVICCIGALFVFLPYYTFIHDGVCNAITVICILCVAVLIPLPAVKELVQGKYVPKEDAS